MTQNITIAVDLDVLFDEMPRHKQMQFIKSHLDILRAKDLARYVESLGLKLIKNE